MTTTDSQPEIPGGLVAENLLSNADMSTYWNVQDYPNRRNRFVVVMTPNGSRVREHATERGTR